VKPQRDRSPSLDKISHYARDPFSMRTSTERPKPSLAKLAWMERPIVE